MSHTRITVAQAFDQVGHRRLAHRGERDGGVEPGIIVLAAHGFDQAWNGFCRMRTGFAQNQDCGQTHPLVGVMECRDPHRGLFGPQFFRQFADFLLIGVVLQGIIAATVVELRAHATTCRKPPRPERERQTRRCCETDYYCSRVEASSEKMCASLTENQIAISRSDSWSGPGSEYAPVSRQEIFNLRVQCGGEFPICRVQCGGEFPICRCQCGGEFPICRFKSANWKFAATIIQPANWKFAATIHHGKLEIRRHNHLPTRQIGNSPPQSWFQFGKLEIRRHNR